MRNYVAESCKGKDRPRALNKTYSGNSPRYKMAGDGDKVIKGFGELPSVQKGEILTATEAQID
jgi:hypothetical protein